jgi:hypothetical protein
MFALLQVFPRGSVHGAYWYGKGLGLSDSRSGRVAFAYVRLPVRSHLPIFFNVLKLIMDPAL